MSTLRRDIRRLLSDQAALQGSFLPLPDNGSPQPQPTPRKQAVNVEPQPSSEEPAATVEPQPSSEKPSATVEPPFDRLMSLLPPDSPLIGCTTLEEVAEYVARTVLVPIDAKRTNPVPGVGNPNADLMVIGEAPGADEDRLGEPFVGRAGQLLDKILGLAGFPREDLFIANILKSRPPNNRDPRPDEVAAHLPILIRQITLVKPKLILCVGRVAGNNLLGTDTSLKALRQTRFHDFHGIPLMVTYHPAALLRSKQYKKPTWGDVLELRARYDELVAQAPTRPN